VTSTAWASIATVAEGAETPGSDRDLDTVTDDRERALRSNPDDPDTDKDGFPDGFEDRLADFGFDLVKPTTDRDRDGLPDAREAELGTNPNAADSDADGWGDFDEELNRYFGYDPRTKTLDEDFDGLGDGLEERLGSSPKQVDTNGDGISDFMAYSADQSPVGPPLNKGLGELIGISYSPAMGNALERIRQGGAFPKELAR
jgi:hypothetical protein